jgi:hypothetical protein
LSFWASKPPYAASMASTEVWLISEGCGMGQVWAIFGSN